MKGWPRHRSPQSAPCTHDQASGDNVMSGRHRDHAAPPPCRV